MKLKLKALPASLRGIYTTRAGVDTLPERFRRMEPGAAAGLFKVEQATGGLIYSDIFRSASESLAARAAKRGVQMPGWSGHNYGLSVDVDVDGTLALRKWKYPDLTAAMEAGGFFCHRRDGRRGAEDWHFNYFGSCPPRYLAEAASGWGKGVELLIQDLYGASMQLAALPAQEALKALGLYQGDADGVLGPLSRQALYAFQRTWVLTETGALDATTQRLLAYVTAAVELA